MIKHNTNTITVRNMRLILNELEEISIYNVSIDDMKNKIKLKEMPEEEMWKVSLIKELTNVKQNKMGIYQDNDDSFFTRKEIDLIIADIATL